MVRAVRNLKGRGKKLWHEINVICYNKPLFDLAKIRFRKIKYKGDWSLRNSLGSGLQLRVEAVPPPTAPDCHCHWSGSNTTGSAFWVTPSHLRDWKLKVSFGTSLLEQLIRFLMLEIFLQYLFDFIMHNTDSNSADWGDYFSLDMS